MEGIEPPTAVLETAASTNRPHPLDDYRAGNSRCQPCSATWYVRTAPVLYVRAGIVRQIGVATAGVDA